MHSTRRSVMENPPLNVEFAGLRGTTYSMQNMGWQLAIEEGMDEYRNGYMLRLAGNHPSMRLKLLSKPLYIDEYMSRFNNSPDYFHAHKNETATDCIARHSINWYEILPPIQICCVAESIRMEIRETRMPNFHPINGTPMFADRQICSLEDMYIFKPLNEDTEIVVPEQTVPELMQLILEKQMPNQKEIRERNHARQREITRGQRIEARFDPENNPAKDIKIQVVSFRKDAMYGT